MKQTRQLREIEKIINWSGEITLHLMCHSRLTASCVPVEKQLTIEDIEQSALIFSLMKG